MYHLAIHQPLRCRTGMPLDLMWRINHLYVRIYPYVTAAKQLPNLLLLPLHLCAHVSKRQLMVYQGEGILG